MNSMKPSRIGHFLSSTNGPHILPIWHFFRKSYLKTLAIQAHVCRMCPTICNPWSGWWEWIAICLLCRHGDSLEAKILSFCENACSKFRIQQVFTVLGGFEMHCDTPILPQQKHSQAQRPLWSGKLIRLSHYIPVNLYVSFHIFSLMISYISVILKSKAHICSIQTPVVFVCWSSALFYSTIPFHWYTNHKVSIGHADWVSFRSCGLPKLKESCLERYCEGMWKMDFLSFSLKLISNWIWTDRVSSC